ncbi:MAG: hypothetical protein ACLUB3_07340 [Clostridium sp.]
MKSIRTSGRQHGGRVKGICKASADADDTYMVTGEEEVYFLYVNNGEDTISCSTTVTRTENGKRKGKDHQTYYHKEL